MIDVESEVITRVSNAVLAQYPDVDIASDWVRYPARFPHVAIYASDNHQLASTWDSGNNVMDVYSFTVQVYSNKQNGKRVECRKILKLIDGVMNSMNMRRESMGTLPNIEDNTIYRMSAVYIVATDGTYFYRR